jgi:hypothetical protein
LADFLIDLLNCAAQATSNAPAPGISASSSIAFFTTHKLLRTRNINDEQRHSGLLEGLGRSDIYC